MDLFNSIIGLLIIGLGFLVKFSPGLIAGYNTMSAEKKKNVDIAGLSTYMRKGLIITGSSIIAGYYLFKWIGFTVVADSMMLISILTGMIIMVKNAQRFDHNKDKSRRAKLTYTILGLTIALVTGLLTYGHLPSKALITNDSIKFSGMYGFELNVSEINSIELIEFIPNIKARTKGFSSGEIKKGFFNLNVFGKTRLLILSNNPPYLIITKNNSDKIIINFKDNTKTEQLFAKLKTLTDSK